MRKKSGRKPEKSADSIVWESLALGLASGILVAIPFLRPSLFWVHYLALVPWILLLTRQESGRVWPHYLIGFYAFLVMGYGPFSVLNKAIPFLAGLVLLPPAIVFPVLFRPAWKWGRVPLVLLVPVVWSASEWLRITVSIGGVGLHPLGSSQYLLAPLIQVADLTGLAGVSFWVAAVNGALVQAWLNRKQWRQALVPLAVAATLVLLVGLYGLWRMQSFELREGPRLGLIQPNMFHYRDAERTKELFRNELEFTRQEIPAGEADLIVWPENSIDYPFGQDPEYLEGLQRLTGELRAPLVAGAFTWASRDEGTLHTSGYYVSRRGELLGRYDKIYLIPWAEQIPYDSWLGRISPALQRWNRSVSTWLLGYQGRILPGEEVRLFPLESASGVVRFGLPICYEVSSAQFARRAVRGGADFLLNISSEGFLSGPVYYHMWAHVIFRAVENRVTLVRTANNGLSGFVDPLGRPYSVLRGKETGRPYLEAGSLVDRVLLNPRPGSFYTRAGDWFAYLCLGLSLFLAWRGFRPGT